MELTKYKKINKIIKLYEIYKIIWNYDDLSILSRLTFDSCLLTLVFWLLSFAYVWLLSFDSCLLTLVFRLRLVGLRMRNQQPFQVRIRFSTQSGWKRRSVSEPLTKMETLLSTQAEESQNQTSLRQWQRSNIILNYKLYEMMRFGIIILKYKIIWN